MQDAGLMGAIKALKFTRPDPMKCIIAIVGSAAVMLIAKKAGVPQIGWEPIAIVLLLGIAALAAEYHFAREAVRAFFERSVAAMLMFTVLWAGAFVYGLNQWLGAASEGQTEKGNIQRSAHTSYTDARGELNRLAAKFTTAKKEVDSLAERIGMASNVTVNGQPVTTPEAAQAMIDKAKAHRLWAQTDGCTNTPGKQTTAFCGEYRQAEAAKSMAANRMTLEAEAKGARERMETAEAAYQQAKTVASTTKVVDSDARSDLRMMTAYLGLSEQQAQDANAVGSIIFISLVMTGLGVLQESKEFRHMPHRPWPWTVWLRRVMFGRKPNEVVPSPDTPVCEVGNRTPDARAYPQHVIAPAQAKNLTRVTVGDINREKLRRLLDGTNTATALAA